MFETVSIYDSRVGAWVNIDSQFEFKNYIKFLASLPRNPWIELKVTVCQRYNYGGTVHGYHVCIVEKFNRDRFIECREKEEAEI